MKIGVLITDHGPHTAARWAEATASQIAELIEVDEKSASPEAQVARRAKPRFETDLTDALEGHHEAVQKGERGHLEALGAERLEHSMSSAEHYPDTLDAALDAVIACAAKTPFAAHFALESTKSVVRDLLATHFNSAMHIERSWHRDRARASA